MDQGTEVSVGNSGIEARLQAALARTVQGDSSAFALIVEEHQAMVFSIAYHFLQDRSKAEDTAQEVFLDLYQKIAGIESPAHLKYWLRRVTVHRCIDQGRRQKYRRETALEEAPEPVSSTFIADPLLTSRLQDSVAALPERQRAVIILRYEEGLGPGEIAEVLNMPVNTVKSMLNRSLAQLRKKLTSKIGKVRYAFF
ncbi:MAG TPA: RNA polymerase sigma factor [Alphaproteobacteria bacterium]|nr:RNA polymerase sigma factor [Alphaproteobacteria bacterium]